LVAAVDRDVLSAFSAQDVTPGAWLGQVFEHRLRRRTLRR